MDVDRLCGYLRKNADDLQRELGDSRYRMIIRQAENLGRHQINWKSIGRLRASIEYRRVRGDIDAVQARYYLNHRVRWTVQEAGRGAKASSRAFARALKYLWAGARNFDVKRFARSGYKFLVSQKFREEFVHRHLDASIESWTKRGQMSVNHAQILRGQFDAPDSSVYITDFGIHIAIKPVVKIFQYWFLPSLFALGLLGGQTVALVILTGGAIGRTLYTTGRLIQSTVRGDERPWVALGVGVMPVLGNFAYPVQMLYSIRGKDENLARFMLDDGFARLGRHLPIWGGQDTWTEHAMNRIPGNVIRWLTN